MTYQPATKRKKSAGLLQTKSEAINTTIMVPETSSVTSVSGGAATYKSISIIASNTETAALGLVSIGNCNFETGSTSLEPQSIIVENIDLEALNPAFVTSSGNQILNWFISYAFWALRWIYKFFMIPLSISTVLLRTNECPATFDFLFQQIWCLLSRNRSSGKSIVSDGNLQSAISRAWI